MFIQTLYTDLVNDKQNDGNDKTLINYLFQINQAEKAKQGFFELISMRNKDMLKRELGDGNLVLFDVELFSRLAHDILESNLNALKTFKDYYLVKIVSFKNIIFG